MNLSDNWNIPHVTHCDLWTRENNAIFFKELLKVISDNIACIPKMCAYYFNQKILNQHLILK